MVLSQLCLCHGESWLYLRPRVRNVTDSATVVLRVLRFHLCHPFFRPGRIDSCNILALLQSALQPLPFLLAGISDMDGYIVAKLLSNLLQTETRCLWEVEIHDCKLISNRLTSKIIRERRLTWYEDHKPADHH